MHRDDAHKSTAVRAGVKSGNTSIEPIPTLESPTTSNHPQACEDNLTSARDTEHTAVAISAIPQLPDAPIEIEIPTGDGRDAEARRRRRKQARDEARAAMNRPAVDVRPSHTITIHSKSTEESATTPPTEIPLQLHYTGTSRVIPSSLASISCASLGTVGLLEQLNDVLGTSYTLDTPCLSTHLEACISCNYDLGTAYGRLRRRWFSAFTTLQAELNAREAEDQQMRNDALDKINNRITKPVLRPRRVWDLYSNRVLPTWITFRDPWAVSHSWMDIKFRKYVDTPINGFEWPVPIPDDTTLERVRIELLNLEAEYVWLDVLCLRQRGLPEKELLRTEEWKVDVPTIGYAYHQNQKVIHYFSGLGRPFRIGDLDSPRHWLNRAWTLQEISENRITAGVAANSPMTPAVDEDGQYVDHNVGKFYDQLGSLMIFAQDLDNIFPVLLSMQNRSAESGLDKVAGLAYLLRSQPLPAYDTKQSVQNAWEHLLETISARYRGDLLFLYPKPGNGRQMWAPSWEQVMTAELPATGGVYHFEEVLYLEEDNLYCHRGYRIDKCLVQGLANESSGSGVRHGKMLVKDSNGLSHAFEMTAHHRQRIPDGEYTLVGGQGLEYWVIGHMQESGRIEKTSVLRLPGPGNEVQDRLRGLGVGYWKNNHYI